MKENELEAKYREVLIYVSENYNDLGARVLSQAIEKALNKSLAKEFDLGKSEQEIEQAGIEELKDQLEALKMITKQGLKQNLIWSL